MARKYRKTLSTGVVPEGDRAWCHHCDDWHYEPNPNYDPSKPFHAETNNPDWPLPEPHRVPCDRTTCECKCHTKPRKPKCLCAQPEPCKPWESPASFCRCCSCYCHIAEVKEYERTSRERDALWRVELERRERERFEKEGVHDWEKKTLEYIMLDPRNLNLKYNEWMYVTNKVAKETGAEFIARMLLTPWGQDYIKEHPLVT